jgi:hypothetical protein
MFVVGYCGVVCITILKKVKKFYKRGDEYGVDVSRISKIVAGP